MNAYQKWLKQIDFLYEDEAVVVVSKPSGLLSIADRYKAEIPNLKAILASKYPTIYTVHRLDKETSGVMIFARTEEAHKYLNEQFAKRKVSKTYWAFVNGTPFIAEGEIDMPIVNEMKNKGRMYISKEGKPALTKFRLVENYGNISLLAFFPVTGRTHQIRVHSQYIGCPLLVDELYAGKNEFYLSSIKKKFQTGKWEEERPLVSRLTLHALDLKLKLPDGTTHQFEAPLPKDLTALKRQLEKNKS